ncbi:MAG: FAD:protein FMN transferase [Actinomycetes bacterium]
MTDPTHEERTGPGRAGALRRAWRAMGTDVEVVLVGGTEAMLDAARSRIEGLEARWSRFRPDSELQRLHEHPGRPVVVAEETFAVLETSIEAWRATGGAFDPSVHDAVRDAGYTEDFDRLDRVQAAGPEARPAPGMDAVALDPLVRSVTLPEGLHLDLGGIGKGRAADLVAHEALAAGARGVCVSIGGDLHVAGTPPEGPAWIIAIEAIPSTHLAVRAGGVATSSTARRRWTQGGEPRHHLIDPRTGAPIGHAPSAVTIVAGDATTAEVLAKAVMVLGPEAAAPTVERMRATGVVVGVDGRVIPLPGFEAFAVAAPSG